MVSQGSRRLARPDPKHPIPGVITRSLCTYVWLYDNTSGINRVSFSPKCFPIYDLILPSQEKKRKLVGLSKPEFLLLWSWARNFTFSGSICSDIIIASGCLWLSKCKCACELSKEVL